MTEKKISGFGLDLPIDRLYVFLSLVSVICFFFSFYVYFFVYVDNPSNNMITAIVFLLIISLVLGFLGFPEWIQEDREESKLRKKRREYEMKKCEKEITDLN
jgi:O-antigen ligase